MGFAKVHVRMRTLQTRSTELPSNQHDPIIFPCPLPVRSSLSGLMVAFRPRLKVWPPRRDGPREVSWMEAAVGGSSVDLHDVYMYEDYEDNEEI